MSWNRTRPEVVSQSSIRSDGNRIRNSSSTSLGSHVSQGNAIHRSEIGSGKSSRLIVSSVCICSMICLIVRTVKCAYRRRLANLRNRPAPVFDNPVTDAGARDGKTQTNVSGRGASRAPLLSCLLSRFSGLSLVVPQCHMPCTTSAHGSSGRSCAVFCETGAAGRIRDASRLASARSAAATATGTSRRTPPRRRRTCH